MPGTDAANIPILRPRTPADADFVAELFARTRGADLLALPEPLRATMMRDQVRFFDAAIAGFEVPSDRIVLADDRPVGRLVEDRRADGWWIVDLSLEASVQGRGIGTAIVRRILAEAQAASVSVGIHVRPGHGALGAWQRLGFVVESQDELQVTLRGGCGQAAPPV